MIRRKDRAVFPDRQILALLRRAKEHGQAEVLLQSPQQAFRLRCLLYEWRKAQRATDYAGLDPELADVAESFSAIVDGPRLALQCTPWEWLDAALVDGQPLREIEKK